MQDNLEHIDGHDYLGLDSLSEFFNAIENDKLYHKKNEGIDKSTFSGASEIEIFKIPLIRENLQSNRYYKRIDYRKIGDGISQYLKHNSLVACAILERCSDLLTEVKQQNGNSYLDLDGRFADQLEEVLNSIDNFLENDGSNSRQV